VSPRQNIVLDLSTSPESSEALHGLFAATNGKGDGRIKCTITKHRIAKTAILLGVQLLLKRGPEAISKLIEKWAPVKKPGRRLGSKKTKKIKTELVLECSSTQGLLEGVDKVWRKIAGEVSHRRVTKAALVLGLDSLSKVEPGKVRLLVSKVCPVPRKYWDPELGLWL
jgi:hypothetical protein